MRVFAVETSCDETSVAVLQDNESSCKTWSQIEEHIPFGGVVPERAARAHDQKLAWLTEKLSPSWHQIDLVAATQGPGLAGALMTGYAYARGVALSLQKPFLSVNHLEAHLYALFLHAPPRFPYLGLLVSGGHTLLVDLPSLGRFRLLGSTVDDAAGECFDKGARMLGLPYPGGRALADLAEEGKSDIPFPVPNPAGLSFSFSGLKTALYRYLAREPQVKWADVAASFQEAIVSELVQKLELALAQTKRKRVIVAGGVAANTRLRERAASLPAAVYFPLPVDCSDNAAMVAICAAYRYPISGATPLATAIDPRLPIQDW